jgi:hypothetical protein
MDEAVIVGVAEEPLAKGVFAAPASPLQAQARVAKAALAQAGLTLADVDGLCTANLWGMGGAGILPTITLSEYLGIAPTFHDGTNFCGAAFEAHVAHVGAVRAPVLAAQLQRLGRQQLAHVRDEPRPVALEEAVAERVVVQEGELEPLLLL